MSVGGGNASERPAQSAAVLAGSRTATADEGRARRGRPSTELAETPAAADEASAAQDIAYASQWRLVWRKFRRHRLAVGAAVVLILLYAGALFAPFLSPHDPNEKSVDYKEAPPQALHWVDESGFHLRPFVYPLAHEVDRHTFARIYREDRSQRYPVRFFVRGEPYRLFGPVTSDIHLFGTGVPDVPVHLFGADSLGRDVLSRILYGSRVSLSIGLLGVLASFFLGIMIGGVAGYFGGTLDDVIQRSIEIIMSVPQLPLWMGLSAALPRGWTVVQVYFAITLIVSLMAWTGLARVVRGKFLSLRQEDFVVAAKLSGMRNGPIIVRHMLPSFLSHIIASLTLSVPQMILAETALSFLGLGMQAPAISWGVLLQSAQNVHTLVITPWLLLPGIFVIVTVLAFNFVGDGMRDAADPYSL